VDTADYAEIHPRGERLKSAIALVGREADADLIAAAPDMFEALTKIAENDTDGLHMYTPQAMQAIARAALSLAGEKQ
jgi:hypothetical protein